MAVPVVFEWDDNKAESNVRKHGLSFRTAIAVFADEAHVEVDATRDRDLEVRRKVIGTISGRIFTLVFVMRGTTCRVISARRSNAKEVRSYGQSHP